MFLPFTLTTSDSVSFSLPVLPGDYRSLDTQRGQVRDVLMGDSFQINPRLPWWLLVASCSFLGCPKDCNGHHSLISFPFCFPLFKFLVYAIILSHFLFYFYAFIHACCNPSGQRLPMRKVAGCMVDVNSICNV